MLAETSGLLWTHSCVHEEILLKASFSMADVSPVRKCHVMQLAPCPLTLPRLPYNLRPSRWSRLGLMSRLCPLLRYQ